MLSRTQVQTPRPPETLHKIRHLSRRPILRRMTGRYVLTIDRGTSGRRVAAFPLDGEYLDGEFDPVELVLSPGGGVEQRPDDWWGGIVACTHRLWDRLTIDRTEI